MDRTVTKERSDVRRHPSTTTATTGRVLLAEDDVEMRKVLGMVLRHGGCRVVEVKNGVELLAYLEPFLFESVPRGGVEDYDLIVSDVRMPGLTGIEVLRGLRALRAHGHRVPFILITAFGDDEIHAQGARLGAVAVLDKPFDMSDFLALVNATLAGAGTPGPSTAAAP